MTKKASKEAEAKTSPKEEKSFEESMKELEAQFEELGEKFGDEFEKAMEKKTEVFGKNVEKRFSEPARKFGYFVTVLVNIFILWTAHNVLNWDYALFDFVQDNFTEVLWAINLSVGVTIFLNLLWMVNDEKIFKGMTKLVGNGFSILLMIVLIVVFPYDFRELIDVDWINPLMKVFFVFGIIGTVIGSVAETAKMLWEVMKEERK